MKKLIVVAVVFYFLLPAQAQNVGIGTNSPAGKLQINHLSSGGPTLNLYDSSTTDGPILQFLNSGGSNFWQIRGLINNGLPTATYLDFATQAGAQMTLRGDGNLGIGEDDPAEKLTVNGNVQLTGEVRRSSTGAANLVPVCYGNVSPAGIIHSGSGNFSVEYITTGWYAITITGESYHFQSYTTVVTPVGSSTPVITGSGSGGSRLYIYTYNASGTAFDNQFSFVVYRQ